jgi:hypothetical protein
MGIEFNIIRERENYVEALKLYQQRLNQHGDTLLQIMSAKEIMEKILDIEKELRSLTSHGGGQSGSAIEEVRNFLSEETVH